MLLVDDGLPTVHLVPPVEEAVLSCGYSDRTCALGDVCSSEIFDIRRTRLAYSMGAEHFADGTVGKSRGGQG